jgi:hypothetical protein
MSLVSLANEVEELELPEGTHVLQYLSDEGDSRIIWDPENPDEVAAAKAQFDTLTGKGYRAYAVRRGGEKGEQVRKFDPNIERLILAPQTVGG